MSNHRSSIPQVISIPGLAPGQHSYELLLVDGTVVSPASTCDLIYRFSSNGRGGFIAPARVAETNKWGYLNERGEWIIAPLLDEAKTFADDSIARFKQGERWGYVDVSGQVIIEAQYEDCRAFGQGLAPVLIGKKWRYIKTSGEFAFEATFDSADGFDEHGLAVACKSRKEKIGYIDTAGEWAIPPQFSHATTFGKDGVAAARPDGDKYGLIDRRGNWVLKPIYSRIEAFNEDGLAHFTISEPGQYNRCGYLNAKGVAVIQDEKDLSESMHSGVVSAYYNGSKFLTKTGKPLTEQRLSFGSHFNAHGFAVVRTPSQQWSDASQKYEDADAAWCLLTNEGVLKELPGEVLEPLTNNDQWLVYAREDTPFAPFLCKDGSIVYVDGNASIIYRISYERQGEITAARLYDAAGKSLWQSDAGHTFHPPSPFFTCGIDAHLDQLKDVEHVVAFAETMIANTEDLLHRFSLGETLADATEEDEDDDEEKEDADYVVTKKRLVRAYVDEAHNGHFDFLHKAYVDIVREARSKMFDRLNARFGESDCDPEARALQNARADDLIAWKIKLKKHIDGSRKLDETSDLWLGFYSHSDSGDGDIWSELWMICAPSIDALHAALRLRTQINAGTNERSEANGIIDSDNDSASDREESPPETYEEWHKAVREHRWSVREVPRELLDEAMIATALDANVEAFECLPVDLQTEERLADLIRRNVEAARVIPVKCMTSAGLALARSLYEEDDHWKWHDERKSKKPKKWDTNSLYDVWGALLTEDECVRAMKGGEKLDNVPLWLRSERVEKAALDTDIYNVAYLDQAKITPELAARAALHSYGTLIEYLPKHLITLELCLISAKTNGLSLEHVPDEFKSIDVCVAALLDDPSCFVWVPVEIGVEVCTRLIEFRRKEDKLDADSITVWHRYRAWAHLWREQWSAALADASVEAVNYEYEKSHIHYIRACAYRALGQTEEAAKEAASTLAIVGDENDYQAEFNDKEDTSWLLDFANTASEALNDADDEAILKELKSHPLTLERVPRERITREMVDTAVATDPNAVQFVPKRLMTSALYAIAYKARHKRFSHIPESMLSEQACIEHVSGSGYWLRDIPMQWRTARVCAEAIHDSESALEYVPESVKAEALRLAKEVPRDDENDNDSDGTSEQTRSVSDWATSKLVDQMLNQETKMKGAKATGLMFLIGMGAKSKSDATLPGLLGWLEQRPFAAMIFNAIFAVVALVCHIFVTVKAWQLEGMWIGLATGVLMGFSELYWVWRFFMRDPTSIALVIAAIIVLVYCFGYRLLHQKVVKAIAAKQQAD